jgi:hypothetical protein
MDPRQSSLHAIEAMEQLNKLQKASKEKELLEDESKMAQIQIAKDSSRQILLIEEANKIAIDAKNRAISAERETQEAKRHAIWANVIGIIAIIVAIVVSYDN